MWRSHCSESFQFRSPRLAFLLTVTKAEVHVNVFLRLRSRNAMVEAGVNERMPDACLVFWGECQWKKVETMLPWFHLRSLWSVGQFASLQYKEEVHRWRTGKSQGVNPSGMSQQRFCHVPGTRTGQFVSSMALRLISRSTRAAVFPEVSSAKSLSKGLWQCRRAGPVLPGANQTWFCWLGDINHVSCAGAAAPRTRTLEERCAVRDSLTGA